ncbi:MAG: neutral/alkaline non-lysosomal ceramidase N-terminal domain-containing protein [Clostridia bacterium]|nr:neutral/alkaline non-lysosomal ceramidase N-terminal domain-containing protein [Clostridia bacterium]
MKRIINSVIAIVLCCCLMMPTVAFAANEADGFTSVEDYVAASETGVIVEDAAPADALTQIKIVFSKVLNFLSNFLINGVVGNLLKLVLPDSAAVLDYESFDLREYENFYAGMDEFIDEPQGDKVWSLGYGKASVLPKDFGEKSYAKGAYLPYVFGNEMYKDEEGKDEDLMARAVVMNDGSGRGNVVFISLDAMGFANSDVRLIREALKDVAAANNIVSVNVSCTHIHTGIDSQGVWTDPVGVIFNNILSDNVKYGVDRSFVESVVEGSKKAVEAALADMTEGELYYSSIDIEDYVWDRTAPIELDTNMYKLEFVPFSSEKAPTIIATFGCHPESASYDWSDDGSDRLLPFDQKFSADFIWYTEKVMNAAGYNFIFIQGNVSTVTSGRGNSNDGLDKNAHDTAIRYGYEIGYILLGMSLNEADRIAMNAATGDKLGVELYKGQEDYTVWYEGLPTVVAQEVKPVLNIKNKQFFVKIENNIIATLGKTSVADNLVLKDDKGNYYTVSEVGYLEIGDNMKVYMSPGETFGELLFGGNGAKGFPLLPIREYTGEDIIIMDLMNDAAGYVANEANFVMAGLQYNEETGEFDDDTWCLISYGKTAGTTFITHFYDIFDNVK